MALNPLKDLQFDASRSLQEQLRQGISQRILDGRLTSLTLLPGSRTLAKDLGVSRNTVSRVYEQLIAEGLLKSQPASGVFVADNLSAMFESGQQIDHLPLDQLPPISDYGHEQVGTVPGIRSAKPFTPGVPDLKAFPNQVWQRILRHHQQRSHLLGYHGLQGLDDLRSAIAEYLQVSRSVRCSVEQVIVTHGAQSALLLTAMVLLNAKDRVLVEDPGYQGARRVFESRGCEIKGAALEGGKLDVLGLIKNVKRWRKKPALLYCTPTHQYPMGGILNSQERLQLLEWASEHQVWILEDDYDSEFHFDAKPFPAIQGMNPASPVIYMGSFSKTLFPSLRMGYLVVPTSLVPIFCEVKNMCVGETPAVIEATLAEFIREGHFYRHLRKMRTLYFEKWNTLKQACETILGKKATVQATSAGMHLVIHFSSPNDRIMQKRLIEIGIWASPLSYYAMPKKAKLNGLVLGFGQVDAGQIPGLVKKIKGCF